MTTFFQNFLIIGQDGLHLIATAVLPVLFPFFVLTSLILNLTTVTHPWFVSLLAYCSGYPNGARLTQNLYEQQRITLHQAHKLLITTSTPSPMFVITTAGIVFLNDIKLGAIIFFCSVLAAIINGYLWQIQSTQATQIKIHNLPPVQSKSFITVFSSALTSATNAILNVSGIVLFFYILTHILNLPPFASGLLEMTTGVAATINPLLIQFFVTFGGLSVAMQQQIFMQNFHIKLSTYCAYKLTHAILACGLLALYLLLLN